jgi:DNA-directed RNA polymerase subunit RPC12/RpoP
MIDKPRVYHQCPNCGYVVNDLQFRYAMFDYPCPRCEVKTLSSFAVRTPDELAQELPKVPQNAL